MKTIPSGPTGEGGGGCQVFGVRIVRWDWSTQWKTLTPVYYQNILEKLRDYSIKHATMRRHQIIKMSAKY